MICQSDSSSKMTIKPRKKDALRSVSDTSGDVYGDDSAREGGFGGDMLGSGCVV